MKVFLLIFSLLCISVTTGLNCMRKNETFTHIGKPLRIKKPGGCEAKCNRTPNCVSWTWNKKDKKCYLIRELGLAETTPWVSGICPGEEMDRGTCTVKESNNECILRDDDCNSGFRPSYPANPPCYYCICTKWVVAPCLHLKFLLSWKIRWYILKRFHIVY